MPGIGFVVFVLPPLTGLMLSILLCFSEKYRYLAVYSFCMPLLGSIVGWYGLNLGVSHSRDFIYGLSHFDPMFWGWAAGCLTGLTAGAVAGFALNRLFLKLDPYR